MSKVIINKHDAYRFLLTDTLPYETPLFFNNLGIYKILNSVSKLDTPTEAGLSEAWNALPIKSILFPKGKPATVPFKYKIKKGTDGYRTLSVAHPASQLSMCLFTHTHAQYVTYLCSKSNFSIRKPTRVAKYFFENDSIFGKKNKNTNSKDDDVEQNVTLKAEENIDDRFASSYFSYDGYTLLYKFYNSLKFQALEKKYYHYIKFDVSKCFDSLYTHSISWAIKGKKFSKDNIRSSSFEDSFDKIIRNMNEGETNGIIIGPEFSRVFAEIILQKIDVLVEKKLHDMGYIRKIDYDIKRYVDDYFVFCNGEDLSTQIYNIFVNELAAFKLFINESKTSKMSRPFITGLSIAKIEVSDFVSEFFDSIKSKPSVETNNKNNTSIVSIYKPYTRSNSLISKFKSIIKAHGLSYEELSSMVLSLFRSRLTNIMNEVLVLKMTDELSHTIKNFLILILDFVFFVYTVSVRVRTSHIVSQILVLVNGLTVKFNLSDRLEVEKKLKDECRFFISCASQSGTPRIEYINTFISLKSLHGSSVVSDEMLYKIYDLDIENINLDGFNYFNLVGMLYLCCLSGGNRELVDVIYTKLLVNMQKKDNPGECSELMHLFLDLGSFPNMNPDIYKKAVVVFMEKLNGITPNQTEVNKFTKYVESHSFFVDWNREVSLERILMRKEMQRGYDS